MAEFMRISVEDKLKPDEAANSRKDLEKLKEKC